jgi:endoglucanase
MAAGTRDRANPLSGDVRFYVEPDSYPLRQAGQWEADGRYDDARLMRTLGRYAQAIWFTKGSPQDVAQEVGSTLEAAAQQHALPVLVAYNVPGRDSSQYSAGGAPSEDAYRDWINAFARGIGDREAVVILEPDGLALLSRFSEISGAVWRLKRNPRTAVYIDAGHSAWHPPNAMASRLLRAGIAEADGFFLNVSNYRANGDLIDYGTRLSKCLAFRRRTGATTCSDGDIASVPSDPRELTHFVIDTSRNGQAPWIPPPGAYSDPEDWCNPPGMGLGARPTQRTDNGLVDAFLWVKRPGESDGSCTRGTAGPEDPEYGMVDPPAGAWWPERALDLAKLADPPLR